MSNTFTIQLAMSGTTPVEIEVQPGTTVSALPQLHGVDLERTVVYVGAAPATGQTVLAPGSVVYVGKVFTNGDGVTITFGANRPSRGAASPAEESDEENSPHGGTITVRILQLGGNAEITLPAGTTIRQLLLTLKVPEAELANLGTTAQTKAIAVNTRPVTPDILDEPVTDGSSAHVGKLYENGDGGATTLSVSVFRYPNQFEAKIIAPATFQQLMTAAFNEAQESGGASAYINGKYVETWANRWLNDGDVVFLL